VLFSIALASIGAAVEAAPIAVCSLPSSIAPVPLRAPPPEEVHADAPTAAYALSLAWTPEYCRLHGGEPDAKVECRDNRFGFVVHGLWPNGFGAVHPRFCRPVPPLAEATLSANLCMTPSAWLLEHEWAAHGACGWPTAEAYFAKARALRTALNVPQLEVGASELTTAGAIRAAFTAVNPGLAREDLYVEATTPDARLQEVHVCYDLSFRWAACLGGDGAEDAAQIRVTPVQ
jgi:ribonuclease T2